MYERLFLRQPQESGDTLDCGGLDKHSVTSFTLCSLVLWGGDTDLFPVVPLIPESAGVNLAQLLQWKPSVSPSADYCDTFQQPNRLRPFDTKSIFFKQLTYVYFMYVGTSIMCVRA